jgi:hypothetical protein
MVPWIPLRGTDKTSYAVANSLQITCKAILQQLLPLRNIPKTEEIKVASHQVRL